LRFFRDFSVSLWQTAQEDDKGNFSSGYNFGGGRGLGGTPLSRAISALLWYTCSAQGPAPASQMLWT
jgi:hypothetical protein